MTNGEKYKTADERFMAFKKFCRFPLNCENCPIHRAKPRMGTIYCIFVWLEQEAEKSEVKK